MPDESKFSSTSSSSPMGRPWARLHIDHAGPFQGKLFLVVVDAFSKWMDVSIVPSTSSSATITVLRSLFATHGLPEIIVSDNGPAFKSEEFHLFIKNNGINHVTSSPYHSASNGLAERCVQTFKAGLRKTCGPDLQTRFLFQYRITPHSNTGICPAELLMGRRPRSHLDLLYPSVETRVHTNQTRQKIQHDNHAKDRSWKVNDLVYVRNYSSGEKWLPGIITAITGPVSYKVMFTDGHVVRRHADQIRTQASANKDKLETKEGEVSDDWLMIPAMPEEENSEIDIPSTQPNELRRSTRNCAPPDQYDPSFY